MNHPGTAVSPPPADVDALAPGAMLALVRRAVPCATGYDQAHTDQVLDALDALWDGDVDRGTAVLRDWSSWAHSRFERLALGAPGTTSPLDRLDPAVDRLAVAVFRRSLAAGRDPAVWSRLPHVLGVATAGDYPLLWTAMVHPQVLAPCIEALADVGICWKDLVGANLGTLVGAMSAPQHSSSVARPVALASLAATVGPDRLASAPCRDLDGDDARSLVHLIDPHPDELSVEVFAALVGSSDELSLGAAWCTALTSAGARA